MKRKDDSQINNNKNNERKRQGRVKPAAERKGTKKGREKLTACGSQSPVRPDGLYTTA